MKELFVVENVSFYEEEFLDDINEYLDIVDLVKDMEESLKIEKVLCAEDNECCEETKDNYFVQIPGFLNSEDEFITIQEVDAYKDNVDLNGLDPFTIRIYKCVNCNKWLIDILE